MHCSGNGVVKLTDSRWHIEHHQQGGNNDQDSINNNKGNCCQLLPPASILSQEQTMQLLMTESNGTASRQLACLSLFALMCLAIQESGLLVLCERGTTEEDLVVAIPG